MTCIRRPPAVAFQLVQSTEAAGPGLRVMLRRPRRGPYGLAGGLEPGVPDSDVGL